MWPPVWYTLSGYVSEQNMTFTEGSDTNPAVVYVCVQNELCPYIQTCLTVSNDIFAMFDKDKHLMFIYDSGNVLYRLKNSVWKLFKNEQH